MENKVFTKATKTKSRLRAALFGPSGAGKTFTALRMASGITSITKVALIDSEHGSASKYADRYPFNGVDLEAKDIDEYVRCINAAAAEGYPVLVIDSLTHAWQELLEGVDKLARAKYKGNTWSAWSEGTPKQKKLINAILSYPGHVIATMRSKTEWQTSVNSEGKVQPSRVGLAPEQGKGIEYEFDLLLELNQDHVANIIKDRTGKYQDKVIDKPGEDFGKELAAWLNDGVEPTKPKGDHAKASSAISGASIDKLADIAKQLKLREWTPEELEDLNSKITTRKNELDEKGAA